METKEDPNMDMLNSLMTGQQKVELQEHLLWKKNQVILEELYKKALEDGLEPIAKEKEYEWSMEYLEENHPDITMTLHLAKIIGPLIE